MLTEAEVLLLTWAPENSPWSPWAKPVLFAHSYLASFLPAGTAEAVALPEWPTSQEGVALIVDLPGAASVAAGMALARRGFRPVPLYNAVPYPSEPKQGLLAQDIAAVEVLSIVAALRDNAPELAGLALAPTAPPAFLLDANRGASEPKPRPGLFDNRSVCFTTDFPSANFLLSHGIARVLLLRESAELPDEDLLHVLRAFQDGGLRVERQRMDCATPSLPFDVPLTSWYRAMFQRALSLLGFSRAPNGGWGNSVPRPSSSG